MKNEVLYLSLNDIVVSNTRTAFDENALKELSHSIKANGVLQPITVNELEEGKYRLITGERRYRASLLAGCSDIPAIVANIPDDKILQVQIIENLQRRNVSTMDEVRAIVRLRDEEGMTQPEIGRAIGKAQSHVFRYLQVGSAHPDVHDALENQQVTANVAFRIAALETHEQQGKAIAALRRANKGFLVSMKEADKYIARHFGAQKVGESGKRTGAIVEVGRYARNWKHYLVHFSAGQYEQWRDIVAGRNEFTVWASAVEQVMVSAEAAKGAANG